MLLTNNSLKYDAFDRGAKSIARKLIFTVPKEGLSDREIKPHFLPIQRRCLCLPIRTILRFRAWFASVDVGVAHQIILLYAYLNYEMIKLNEDEDLTVNTARTVSFDALSHLWQIF